MENSSPEIPVQSRRRSLTLADWLSGLVIFGTLFAGAFAFICLQDDIKAYDFQISDTLKPYVQKLNLTEKASKTLLATHPALQEKQAFNQSCHSHNHEVYVLGCYVHDSDRIYLYHVESNDLPGVIEVTTAHEMLHAAYQRVPFWEMDRLNEEIKKAYDKLTELYNALKEDKTLAGISIKSFERPETLSNDKTSIVIKPVGSPMQAVSGSDTSLAKVFLYQINVESKNRVECKELQRKIEKIMEEQGFYQTTGGLDEWIPEIKRYVDARTYKGRSALYEEY